MSFLRPEVVVSVMRWLAGHAVLFSEAAPVRIPLPYVGITNYNPGVAEAALYYL